MRLDTSIFERTRTRDEAKRAHRLENIYHAGQEKIWNGRELLDALVTKHGGIQMGLEKKRALARVFSGLMWGELAAWKISAQLSDQLTDIEAKMAATSQVHDEARHFYVLHDYLERLEIAIPDLDIATRTLLESVLDTESVAEKLVGMQLFVETMAITVFKMVRELKIEPVLSELMLYYERDEARHIGLGVQYTPELVRSLNAREIAHLAAFQAKILIAALFSLKRMEPSLRVLGVEPRALADCGQAMCERTLEDLHQVAGGPVAAVAGPTVVRSFKAAKELMFPAVANVSILNRMAKAGRALVVA